MPVQYFPTFLNTRLEFSRGHTIKLTRASPFTRPLHAPACCQ